MSVCAMQGCAAQFARLWLRFDPTSRLWRGVQKAAKFEQALHVISSRPAQFEPERRPVVEALVRLGPVEKRIRLTVTNRAVMRCRMLLGREALQDDFVVDVRRKYVCSV